MKFSKTYLPITIIIAVASGLISMNVQAVGTPINGPIPFPAYDTDNSNSISKAEFDSAQSQRMEMMRAAGRAMRGSATQPDFSNYDTDGNGLLNQQELVSGQRIHMQNQRSMGTRPGQTRGQGRMRFMPTYNEFDLNGDGIIFEKEFIDARNQRIAERAKKGFLMQNLGNADNFATLDKNADGVLSTKEFKVHQASQM